MTVKYLLAASAFAILAPSLASAADIAVVKKNTHSIASTFSWSGFYVGGQIGYSKGKDTNTFSKVLDGSVDTASWFSPTYFVKPDGWMIGAYTGYNAEIYENVILGIETEVNTKGFGGDFVYPVSKFPAIDNDPEISVYKYERLKTKWNGATRLRLGYDYGHFMPYLALGMSYMIMDVGLKMDIKDGQDIDLRDIGFNQDFSFVGWTIGAGLDYALMDNVILRAEYRYNDFGNRKFDYINVADFQVDNFSFEKNIKSNDLRFGIAYKF